ncbi:hypothetical protein HPB51_019410 [Rhipicephalus microplus]|uniref:Uncharacterized protein n=1 Tax=Rhipicephalus microplus TaxID=6941 RepID=A0A9J6DB94_RHIMP|nr:hypothetical protein HPB51_019410 [Rhipicephalus microplus]
MSPHHEWRCSEVGDFRSCVVLARVVVRWRSVGAPDNLPCGSASAERPNEPLLPDRCRHLEAHLFPFLPMPGREPCSSHSAADGLPTTRAHATTCRRPHGRLLGTPGPAADARPRRDRDRSDLLVQGRGRRGEHAVASRTPFSHSSLSITPVDVKTTCRNLAVGKKESDRHRTGATARYQPNI